MTQRAGAIAGYRFGSNHLRYRERPTEAWGLRLAQAENLVVQNARSLVCAYHAAAFGM